MEIENYREGGPADKWLAKFDLTLANGMTIHEVKVIRSKKGPWFFALPSFSVENQGVRRYFPYISFFNDEKREEFTRQVMHLLKDLVRP